MRFESILGSGSNENKTFPTPPSPSTPSMSPICEPLAGWGCWKQPYPVCLTPGSS